MRLFIAKFCLVIGICALFFTHLAHSSNVSAREDVIHALLSKKIETEADLFLTKTNLFHPETGEVNQSTCEHLHSYFTAALDANPRDKFSHTYFGYFYENGIGFDSIDDQKAMFHFRIAALQGVLFAQKRLASLYYDKITGKTASEYDAKFLYWAKKLGRLGHVESLTDLRKYYNRLAKYRHDSTANTKALKWIRKAAEAGDHESMRIYAGRLERGIGCTRNKENEQCALFWYLEDAKTNSCPKSMCDVARCYESGIGCDISETSDQIALKYYQLAVDYKAGELALLKLADMLCAGIGCEESFLNEIKANKFYLRAASEYSSIEAMTTLSSNLFKGIGCTGDKNDHIRGMSWLKRAHEIGDSDCSLTYANNLAFGRGCDASEENRREALKIALKLAGQQEKKAMLLAGLMLCHGIGCPETERNREEGVTWLEKAAHEDVPEAHFHLGYCLLNGIGYENTLLDKQDAMKKFQQAADLKVQRANHALAHCLLLGLNKNSTAGIRIVAVTEDTVKAPDTAYYARLALSVDKQRQDQKRALKLLRKSVEDGFIDSHAYLGFCLLHNIGCAPAKENRKVGLGLLRDAAVEDHEFSRDFLAYIYAVGYQGIKPSTKLALHYSLESADTELNLMIQLHAFLSDRNYKSASESVKKLSKLADRMMLTDDVLGQVESYIKHRNNFSVIRFSKGKKGNLSKKQKNKLFTPFMLAQLINVAKEYQVAMKGLEGLMESMDVSEKQTNLKSKYNDWRGALRNDQSEDNVVYVTQPFLYEISTVQEEILLTKIKSTINRPFEYWTKRLFGTPFGFMPDPETGELTENLTDDFF